MDAVSKLAALEKQLENQGEAPDLLLGLARVWRRLSDPAKAARYARRCLELDQVSAPAWNTLGACLMDLEKWSEAEGAFIEALKRDPGFTQAEQNLALALRQQTWDVQTAAQQGDWSAFDTNGKRLLDLHRKRTRQVGLGIVTPFSVLGFHLTAPEQRQAALMQAQELCERDESGSSSLSLKNSSRGKHRIGYLSADFRNNAAGHLLHQLFARHDRAQFEIYALSYGPEDGSEFRRAIISGVDRFVELRDLSDKDAATAIRALDLHLVVDLMGFAGNHRAGILARRPAPVQVSWLGYCMTTGAPWIDWFIADRQTVPESLAPAFTEKLAYLPHSYQVYSGQAFERGTSARKHFGLPEDAMVYCCFNMPEKVDPTIWAVWMRVLSAVPGSVLWLLCENKVALYNYQKRTAAFNIDPNRIIPAALLPKQQHLMRLELADLFLDTTLCNAHTTASDALWAGVPVLTCPGGLFAQRVAASVCVAAGLPDLIVDSLTEYETTAIQLGKDSGKLRSLRAKLADSRKNAPLFDVESFAGDLERCFGKILSCRAPLLHQKKLPLVMVLGPWRSGTSALAGVLHQLGVHFGEYFGQLRHPTPYPNTFEAADLFPIIWASLKEPEMSSLRPMEETAAELASWLHQHNALSMLAGQTVFGMKHPAASMLAEQIKALWPKVLTVRTQRNTEDCLQSTANLGWEWPRDKTLKGLNAQHNAAVTACEGPVFEFPNFLETPKDTVDRLCSYLGLKPSSEQRKAACESLLPQR